MLSYFIYVLIIVFSSFLFKKIKNLTKKRKITKKITGDLSVRESY